MKSAAKVLIVISIIFSFWAIYPLVLGIIAYKKLEECKEIEEIRVWGIVTLLLVSPIAGVLMLVMKEEDLYDSPEEAAEAKAMKQAMQQGYYPPQGGANSSYCGYDAYGGYYDGTGGYYDAEGGYYAPDGTYYPPNKM